MLNFVKQSILSLAIVLFLAIPISFASTTFTINNIGALPISPDPGGYDTGIGSLNFYFTASTNTTITQPAADLQPAWFGFTPEGNGTMALRWNAGDTTGFTNPLQDGTIATLTFTGATGLVLSGWEFFDYALTPITEIQLSSNTMSGTGDGNVTFNAVPIPGSILLLGSGILGLVGLSRRKRS